MNMNNSKIDRMSPSMLSLYMQCPLAFYYAYVAKIHLPQKQIHLLFGTAIHKAIEDGVYNTLNPYKVFEETFDKNRLTDEEKELHSEYLKLGSEMVKNYIESHETLNSLYQLDSGESEKYIKRHLINPLTGEESTLPMTGKLDRLTIDTNSKEYNRIVEYKTSKNKWNPADVNFKIQTLMYNLWYYSEYKVLPEETVYIILLKKYKKYETDQTYQALTTHCTLVDLAAVFEEIEMIVQKINNNEFERPTGYHPRWCDCFKYEEVLNVK